MSVTIQVEIRVNGDALAFKRSGLPDHNVRLSEQGLEWDLKRALTLLDEIRDDFKAVVRSHERAITGAPDPLTGVAR